MAKLDVKAFGLALGILWAASLFIMGIIARQVPGYAADFVAAVGSKYIGYAPCVKGSIIGALWGFVDACIAGLVLAWLYNLLSRK